MPFVIHCAQCVLFVLICDTSALNSCNQTNTRNIYLPLAAVLIVLGIIDVIPS